jgi:hypothetical protein
MRRRERSSRRLLDPPPLFLPSRFHYTERPSPKRYGWRYEIEVRTDYVRGNHGDDHVIPGPQVDAWIRGGAGNDIMETDDGEQEQVECGSGLNDQAYIDVRSVRDGFANCEYFNGKNLDDDTFDCDTWSEAPPKDQR